MPTVVIIHAAEDALPARALAEKLRAARLTPVIEQPPGDQLRAAVRDAAVTLALWSPRSVSQADVASESDYARSHGRLLHVKMQNAAPPESFANEPTHDLTGWRGEDFFPGWRGLLEEVAALAGVPAPPAPTRGNPTGPGGFFQPGAPPDAAPAPAPQQRAPAPQAPRPAAQQQPAPAPRPAPPPRTQEPRLDTPPLEPSSGGGGKGLMIVIALVVIAIVGGGGYFLWSNMQGSQQASSAWENVDRNDASALRAFIDTDPGNHRDAAVQALTELEEQSFDAAQEEDTIDAFESFLNDFPESDHAIAARGRIAELRSMPPTDETLPGDGTTLAPPGPAVDPDLLPPSALTTPAPPAGDQAGGPTALTPPAPEPEPEPTPAPSPELPTN